MLLPLAISAGDPAGVGPVVTAAAIAEHLGKDRALVYGDADWMERALIMTSLSMYILDYIVIDYCFSIK